MQLGDLSANVANLEIFSAFVEHTPAAVAMLDHDLRYLLTSRRWLADYALDNQNLKGRSHCEVFPLFQEERGTKALRNTLIQSSHHPSTAQALKRWQKIYRLGLAGESQQGDSDYFIRSDGSRQRVKWEIQPWRTQSGEIGGVMMFTEFQEHPTQRKDSLTQEEDGYCQIREQATERIWGTASLTKTIEQLQQESTERKQAQALQQESEERYRSLIAAMAEGIIVLDANGLISTCNAAAERILGLSAEQMIGLNSLNFHRRTLQENGEPFAVEEYPINVTLRTGQSFTDVVVGIYPDEETLTWLSINSRPLFHPNQTKPYAVVASFIDISKRKQFEVELRESEERFRSTFEQAAVGINHAEPDGRFTRVNQKFCEITGYSREEMLVRTFQDITYQDDLSIDLEYVRSLLADEIKTYSLEKRYVRKDGQLVWVQITAALVRTSQGDPKYFLSVVQDISLRKTAESALRHSEAQLRERFAREALLNQLSNQIRNSLELNTILDITVQEIRQMLKIDRCHFAWYCPYGTQAYWEVVKEARHPDVPDLRGRYPVEAIGPLAEQLLNLEVLQVDDVEAVSDPVFQQFIRALGYSSVLVLPMQTPSGTIGVISCGHGGEPRPWTASEVELLQAVTDQLLIAIQQAELYAASRMATQKAQEQATQLEKALRELKQTQTQLIQSEKMSSLGQLVAGVAHEINNPVNFIYGNLIYAQEYFQDILGLLQMYRSTYTNPPAAIKERIDAIDLDFLVSDLGQLQDSMKVGAERIREIVRSLRIFSRVDESDNKQVDIHAGLESTLMILHNRLKGKPGYPAISVIKDYGDLPFVECYPGQLNQVFMNLISNAIDALEEKLKNQRVELLANQSEATSFSPTITITTGTVIPDSTVPSTVGKRLRGNTHGDISHIFIRIADNGSGMTQKTQQQLFEPFFTTKPVGKGTGLGLAISYQIVVEKHCGNLRCHSIPEQGTEFVVEIPIRHR